MVMFLLAVACTLDEGDTDKPADTDTDSPTDDSGTPTDDTGTGPDPATVPLDGVCSDETHWGAFFVDSNQSYAYTSGSLADGIVPVTVLTNVLTTGDCTIWRRENPFCDPGCDPGFTCSLEGECVPYPTNQDVGTVTLDGLAQSVAMEPVVPGYTYFDTTLPNPPWTPGDLLTLKTGGGTFDPVTIYGVAPADLAPTTMEWVVVEGQPLAVSWTPPAEGARTEVVLELRIDLHGVTPSHIECVFDDDGAGEVPADVLGALMDLGVTGFPEGSMKRRTADSAPVGDGGCVDLEATSSYVADIEISGYTPCRQDEDCPDGTTCNEELERCE